MKFDSKGKVFLSEDKSFESEYLPKICYKEFVVPQLLHIRTLGVDCYLSKFYDFRPIRRSIAISSDMVLNSDIISRRGKCVLASSDSHINSSTDNVLNIDMCYLPFDYFKECYKMGMKVDDASLRNASGLVQHTEQLSLGAARCNAFVNMEFIHTPRSGLARHCANLCYSADTSPDVGKGFRHMLHSNRLNSSAFLEFLIVKFLNSEENIEYSKHIESLIPAHITDELERGRYKINMVREQYVFNLGSPGSSRLEISDCIVQSESSRALYMPKEELEASLKKYDEDSGVLYSKEFIDNKKQTGSNYLDNDEVLDVIKEDRELYNSSTGSSIIHNRFPGDEFISPGCVVPVSYIDNTFEHYLISAPVLPDTT